MANAPPIIPPKSKRASSMMGASKAKAPSKPKQNKKLVIVGDGAAGKTCLLIVFAKNEFPEDYTPTVFENYIADITVEDTPVELALWDTAGQEDYDQLRPLSYPDTDCLLVVYSVASPDSLENVEEKWVPEVKHFCEGVPFILVGCKVDLRNDPDTIAELKEYKQKPVSAKRGAAVAKRVGAAAYLECSAIEGIQVQDVFHTAVKTCLGIDSPKLATPEESPPWDCRHLGKDEALGTLAGKPAGTFVIRASTSKDTFATLSMVTPEFWAKAGKDPIFHTRILESSKGLRFMKTSVFHRDLETLIKHHAEFKAHLPCMLIIGQEEEVKPAWNAIGLSKAEAEVRLVCQPVGAFVVRNSKAGAAALVFVNESNTLERLQIDEFDDDEGVPLMRLKGSDESFGSLQELASFYMQPHSGELSVRLLCPATDEDGVYGSVASDL